MDIRQTLQQSFLLEGADDNCVQSLLNGDWQVLNFSKGQLIWGGGLREDYLGIMLKGRARALSGGTATLRGFAKGDVFGAAAMYAQNAETVSRVQAENNCAVLFLPLMDIQHLISTNSRVAENYIRFLAQKVAFLNRKIAAFTAGEAARRLSSHIYANACRDERGRLIMQANISKLAQLLGISRASLYRALAQLTKEGLLHREGKLIVVDKKTEVKP